MVAICGFYGSHLLPIYLLQAIYSFSRDPHSTPVPAMPDTYTKKIVLHEVDQLSYVDDIILLRRKILIKYKRGHHMQKYIYLTSQGGGGMPLCYALSYLATGMELNPGQLDGSQLP